MENQQTTTEIVTTAQDQPLNSPPENGNNENSVEKSRKARITKIKQQILPGVKITLLLSLIIYLAMFIVGILGVHHCPVDENIPLFLIATGAIGFIAKIVSYMREHIVRHFKVGYMESSFYTVELVFLVLGAYWVYKQYPPSYNPLDGIRYCQKTAYMFAFVYITVLVACCLVGVAGFIFFLLCMCLMAGGMFDTKATERPVEPQEGSAA